MKKQNVSALLLLTALVLASCGESTPAVTDGTDDAADTKEAQTKAAVTEDVRAPYADQAPRIEDFNGYEFRIFVHDGTKYDSDEETGEIVNDAIYRRNKAVEEAYNINISTVSGFGHDEDRGLAMQSIQAGDDFADVLGLFLLNSSMLCAQEGALLDWNRYADIRPDAPWWDERITDLSVYGKQYVLAGDIATCDDLRQMVVTYNKAIWNEMDYEDAYTMVWDGKWTLDKMYALAKDVSFDLDGDGKMTVNDRFGILSETKAAWYLFLGSGQKSIVYEDGAYLTNLSDEKNFDVMSRVLDIMCDMQNVCVINDGKHDSELTTGGVWEEASKIFAEGRTLFHTETFNGTEKLRNMDQDYGILPIPKWTEEQEAYYCMTNDDICALSMPTTSTDPDRTALITEALAYESMFVLQPTFYEVYLSEKLLRDEQSRQMMDLVLDSKFYDMDFCFGAITTMSSAMENMASTKQNKLASRIASIEKSAQKRINRYLDALQD